MTVFVSFLLILALAGYSDANYCVCNSGLSDAVLQKSIDYACGAGADCAQIQQNGPCFNPNTVRDHCSYAVNSYYQKKGNAPGSCDFSGTASVSPNPPSGASSACVYPSSSSNAGSTTPSTTPPTGGIPTTPTPPGSPTTGGTGGSPPTTGGTGGSPPTTGGTGGTTPGTFPGGSTTPGATPGSPFSTGFGLAPTGSGGTFSNTGSVVASSGSSMFVLVAVVLISSVFY